MKISFLPGVWYTPAIPKLSWKKEDEELKVSLGYFEGWKAAWATWDAVSKDNNNNNNDSPFLMVGQVISHILGGKRYQ